MPSPSNLRSSAFNVWYITYDKRNATDNIKADIIATRCALLFFFLMKNNPVSRHNAVPILTQALNLGRKLRSSVPVTAGGAIFNIAITNAGTNKDMVAMIKLIVLTDVFCNIGYKI